MIHFLYCVKHLSSIIICIILLSIYDFLNFELTTKTKLKNN